MSRGQIICGALLLAIVGLLIERGTTLRALALADQAIRLTDQKLWSRMSYDILSSMSQRGSCSHNPISISANEKSLTLQGARGGAVSRTITQVGDSNKYLNVADPTNFYGGQILQICFKNRHEKLYLQDKKKKGNTGEVRLMFTSYDGENGRLRNTYPEGSIVRQFQEIRYDLDDKGVLRHGATKTVRLASAVSDLRFRRDVVGKSLLVSYRVRNDHNRKGIQFEHRLPLIGRQTALNKKQVENIYR